jgi:putative flippase GtrA
MEATLHEDGRLMLWRWLKFNSVGAIGVGVQLAVLTLLAGQLGVNYLVATALAVETAVVHNFVWHEKWTWADRFDSPGWHARLKRLLQFNVTTGAVSIIGNLVFMKTFVGMLGIHFLAANLMTIAVCSVVNFLVSDRIVFQPNLWGRSAYAEAAADPQERSEQGGLGGSNKDG